MLITAFAVMLAVVPIHVDDLMGTFVVTNLAFLALRITVATQASVKSD